MWHRCGEEKLGVSLPMGMRAKGFVWECKVGYICASELWISVRLEAKGVFKKQAMVL